MDHALEMSIRNDVKSDMKYEAVIFDLFGTPVDIPFYNCTFLIILGGD